MTQLPAGTVTFLFTDIEGSTRLLHELGDRYAEVLAEHRRVLRAAFDAHGGVEVDTQGDAFFVAFARASDALAAAGEAQAALDGVVRVRMGVHTGEPLVTDEGYVGIDVHRAARVAAAGHGGQVLVSQATRDLTGGDGLRDLGEHRLKDLTAPERIFQLGDGEFPPLKSLNATNLPVASSALVGRARELQEIGGLVTDSARVVTLTGPGGTGKTRLALQVAAELVDDFAGGVFFVPLAGVQQPELVPATIAATIGVHAVGELRDREALIVLDNFEHLLDAAPSVADLVASAERAKVITTSRAPLRIEGEQEYAVHPLPDNDAVTLLTERARAVRADFAPDEATAEICRRLDGLPLALELAASRLRSLGSSALLERLDQRLPLLTSGRRDAPERQRTLRATIEWSYDLLDERLQRVFERLGVFATFTLEAAEVVADATFDDVDALVEASLLKPVRGDRFLMLETIREFALERLGAGGKAGDVRLRHAEWIADLSARANLTQESDGPMRHQLVAPERNNVRGALAYALETENGDLGLRIATALENYWITVADPAEGIRWIERLLPLGPEPPSLLHALGIRCLGNCAAMQSSAAEAEVLYRQSFDELHAIGDTRRAGVTLHRVAVQAGSQGERERARRHVEEALEMLRAVGFKRGEAAALGFVADLTRKTDPEASLSLYDDVLVVVQETGFTWYEKGVHLLKALAFFDLGRPVDAERESGLALSLARAMEDRIGVTDAIAFIARASVQQGDVVRAGQLWGALEAENQRSPVAAWEVERERTGPFILTHAGPTLDEALEAGRKLSLDEAVELAMRSVD